jgi:predicted transport protein
LVANQYQGKEHFKPIYDQLVKEISTFGEDVELAPKKAYVSVRRKRQFAILQPSTKSRFDIGLNIKGKEPEGPLEKAGSWNSMCTHRIKTSQVEDLTPEVIQWIKEAYEGAG